MSEQTAEPTDRPAPTGVTQVDAVVDAVADLDGLTLAEQVGVFDSAHAQLRRTLDDPAG